MKYISYGIGSEFTFKDGTKGVCVPDCEGDSCFSCMLYDTTDQEDQSNVCVSCSSGDKATHIQEVG